MALNEIDLLTLAEDSPKLKELQNTQNILHQTLSIKDRELATQKLKTFSQELKNLQDLQDYFAYQNNQSIKRKYEKASINIPIPIHKIGRESFVCDGSIGSTRVKFFVCCKYFDKLKLSDEEKRKGVCNLLDHFDELMPDTQKAGLITFQNGMCNSPKDFIEMGKKICDRIPEGTLCIGLYNPSEGFLSDLLRVNDKLHVHLSDICCYTYAIMRAFAKKLWRPQTHNYQQPYWCHFAHSEGGIIARLCLILIEHDRNMEDLYIKECFPTQFIPVTFGAVLPIPTSYAKKAMNTYSEKDEATLPRVKRYLESIGDEKKYYENVKIVKCEKLPDMAEGLCLETKESLEEIMKMPFFERQAHLEAIKAQQHCNISFAAANALLNYVKGDHDFQGDTYKKALLSDISDLRKDCKGFYNGR